MRYIICTSITMDQEGQKHPTLINVKKTNRNGHILRRYCLLKHVIEVKVEAKRS